MIILNIDRIVLDGFNISQSRAENIKLLIQTELQSRFSQNNSLHEVRDKEITDFNTFAGQINESTSDTRIATSIASSIMSSINSKPTK